MEHGLYPLTFKPIYKQKVWGGRALARLGRQLPGDGAVGIGESWELADLSTTSVSGGGGGAEHSIVAEGPLAGQTIRQLMDRFNGALLGPSKRSADGGFPLLIKFLDARKNLSVQVHPSPAYAQAHPEAHLKSEAWYIVDAEPGAVIYKGLKPGVTPQQLREAIEANTDQAVLPLLCAVPVKPGDCHYLPSGTLHALGAGVVVAEVQTPSDTTFRVYDWGRTSRELHIEQALACIDFDSVTKDASAAVKAAPMLGGFDCQAKTDCAFFRIHEVSCVSPVEAEVALHGAEAWIALDGTLALTPRGDAPCTLPAGSTTLLPAALESIRLSAPGPGKWLRVTLA